MQSDRVDEQIEALRLNGIEGDLLEQVSKAARFHGHICPGLVIGVSASISFLRGKERSPDEELVAVVENDACGVDAIQALLGCTFGKGNLIFLDHGKTVYTFHDRRSDKATRYSFNGMPQREDDDIAMVLFSKVRAGDASNDEEREFRKMWIERAAGVLSAGEDLFDIREIKEQVPEKARLFGSFTCEGCGEKAGEHRSVTIGDRKFCIPCSKRAR